MIFVHPNGERNFEDVKGSSEIAKKIVENSSEKKVKYLARDGLTPPTVDIRN